MNVGDKIAGSLYMLTGLTPRGEIINKEREIYFEITVVEVGLFITYRTNVNYSN